MKHLALLYARAPRGLDAPLVTVEVHLSMGLPSFAIVGLPEAAVKESRERVRSAILNSGYEFPLHRITVNLAPADLPKEGGRFDLAIAVGILLASAQVHATLSISAYEFAGELALTGELRSVASLLPWAIACKQASRALILPQDNVGDALLCNGLSLWGAKTLREVCDHMMGLPVLVEQKGCAMIVESAVTVGDLQEVLGQVLGKRALEIAAAGGHSMLMVGPPGSGKTMLASRLPGILPPLSETEALAVAAVHSLSTRGFSTDQFGVRPFRAPHHTMSAVALVGGGRPPKPGEISLAHYGVLFLDELPEFNRHALEALREPLEARTITISRAAFQYQFPAAFQWIAAMNPCPCGYYGDLVQNKCRCLPDQVQRYQNRLSGPLLDRIDLYVDMPVLPQSVWLTPSASAGEGSASVRARVVAARERQLARNGTINAWLAPRALNECASPTEEDATWLKTAVATLQLSARAYQRIRKIARTVADLADEPIILRPHWEEALLYRRRAG